MNTLSIENISMNHSQTLYDRAQNCIPAGVNSPVRAFGGVGGSPIFIDHAKGAYLYDVDGKRYIDYIGSWGPMIVGHAHPDITQAVQAAVSNSLSFGAPTALEVELAEKICALMPSIDMIRMVNSGTEATTTAIRLARGFSGRDKIIKFIGCYHGHNDPLLVAAGSGGLTFGKPSSAGIPRAVTDNTLVVDYNDLAAVEKLFNEHADSIAAVIVEPIAGNMNMVLPKSEFLPGLRQLCDRHQALLIFDEVMTGFRVALGGAQALYNVTPDLTTLGKIIGGGCPVGAIGGRRDIMSRLAPLGDVYQAGTLSGNPIAMTAGLTNLKLISQPDFYDHLRRKTQTLLQGFAEIANAQNIALQTCAAGSMFGLHFSQSQAVYNLTDVQAGNSELFARFFHSMLEQGVYLAPSMYEAGFISAAHSDEDIQHTLQAFAIAISHFKE